MSEHSRTVSGRPAISFTARQEHDLRRIEAAFAKGLRKTKGQIDLIQVLALVATCPGFQDPKSLLRAVERLSATFFAFQLKRYILKRVTRYGRR